MKSNLIGFSLLLATAGCGSNSSADVDSFIGSLAAQQCDWEFRCCKDAEIKQLDGRKYAAEEDCIPYKTLALEDQLFLERLAAREGRLRVDSTRAGACLAQLTAKACNPMPGTPVQPPSGDPMLMDACINVLIGSTPVGSECVYTDECVDGARCVGDAEAVGRGVCVPYQEETDICNVTADCDPKVKGLYCAPQDFHCHLRARLGEACAYTTDSLGKNPTLPLLLECDNQLGNVYCDPISSTCRQLPSDGEPCLSPPPPGVSSSCDPDPTLALVCDTTGGGTTGVCRAPGKVNEDCSTRACAADLYCDTSTGTSSICRALPDFGAQCSASGGRCKKPYYCNFSKAPEVCDQPASIGEDCTSVTCDTGLTCDANTRLCKSLLPDGSPCVSSTDCLSFSCGFSVGQTTQRTCQPQNTTITVMCSGR